MELCLWIFLRFFRRKQQLREHEEGFNLGFIANRRSKEEIKEHSSDSVQLLLLLARIKN